MTAVSGPETTQIALRVSRTGNPELLADLLGDKDIVDITESVPDDTDRCLVAGGALSSAEDVIAEWKQHQRPLFAPVILLSESSGPDPWKQHGDVIGDGLDAIQLIPAPRAAIRARVESLLQTHQYSRGLLSERHLVERIFETTPIAQTVLDTDGIIVRANRRAEELFGLAESEISGRT